MSSKWGGGERMVTGKEGEAERMIAVGKEGRRGDGGERGESSCCAYYQNHVHRN